MAAEPGPPPEPSGRTGRRLPRPRQAKQPADRLMADPCRLQVAACHRLPQRLGQVHEHKPPHRSESPPFLQPLRTDFPLL